MTLRLTEAEYARIDPSKKTARPTARPRSPLEQEMERQMTEAGFDEWQCEYEFHPERKWRLDFAWPDRKLALEVDGGVHRLKNRFSGDIEKQNSLALRGWRLIRVNAKMIGNGKALETMKEALRVFNPTP